MATFTNFATILPSPTYQIGDAGQADGESGANTSGPGYASVTLSSSEKILKNRTNSGRYISRSATSQFWKIDISYNPMTRAQFNPIQTFLMSKRGGLIPFYVSLPQYETLQDTTFNAATAFYNALSPATTVSAGESSMIVGATSYAPTTTHKTPLPGDVFTVSDSNDSNHQKAYMVTGVETPDLLQSTTTLSANQIKIHFSPQMQKLTSTSANLIFKGENSVFKVVQSKDVVEYSLGTNNLYNFSLSLEEVQ